MIWRPHKIVVALVVAALIGFGPAACAATRVDRILIEKSLRKMALLLNGKPIKVYPVALGRDPLGPKERQGDLKTPEGIYRVDYRNPKSQFYRSLHLSYPNEEDRRRAQRLGVSPGGDIMIHGQPNSMGRDDPPLPDGWTLGCIAVSNDEMDEIWGLVTDGTTVEIRP